MDSKRRVFSVSELTGLIKANLEDGFPSVLVEGEISNCRPASSGHLYFSLKDQGAVIQAVMFRYRTRGLGFEPADGLLVRARGAVTVYAARGNYQILVESLEKAGEGDLLAMLEARKRKLAALGLFDEDRKRPLPRFPSRVAVITSPTGAAVRDIINVARRRNPGLSLTILPAAVQGEAAAADLVAQLDRANRHRLGEVIILGRGGGSIEDLLPFSDEAVVRAVAASDIPVISAVGHEIDWALSDFAADLRAPTPSAAAELVTESSTVARAEVAQLREELAAGILHRLDKARSALGRFEATSVEARFMKLLLPVQRRLDEARDDLLRGLQDGLSERRRRLGLATLGLEASSPEAILARGFAVVRDAEGRALREARGLEKDALVDIHFARGRASARIEEITP